MSDDESAPTNLLKKLNSIMHEIGQIEKTGHNDHFHYDFVEKPKVFKEFREKFYEHDVQPVIDAYDQEIDRYQVKTSNGTKTKAITTTRVELTLYDVESGESITFHMPAQGMDTQDKGVAKAVGLAVKYLLLDNFLIDSGEDDPDTRSHSSSSGDTSSGGSSGGGGDHDYSNMDDSPGSVSSGQTDFIWSLCDQKMIPTKEGSDDLVEKDKVAAHVKKKRGIESFSDLSKQKASMLIDDLQELPDAGDGGSDEPDEPEEPQDPEEILDDVEVEKDDDIPF